MQFWIKKYGLVSVLIIYLLLSLVFGGAGREGRFAHAMLQSLAAFGLAVLAVSWPTQQKITAIRTPIALVLVLISIALLQSVPLPETVWPVLPGRGRLLDGFHSLGVTLGPMPLSLDVEATLSTISYAFPPLFVMVICLRIGLRRLKSVIPWFVSIFAVSIVVLGMVQVIYGSESGLYFYENTNVDLPVGTFANVNHFASFLLISMPFTVFLLRDVLKSRQKSDAEIGKLVAICGMIVMIIAGIVAAGSLAVYLLSVPAGMVALIAIRRQVRDQLSMPARVAVIAVVLGTVSLVATSPLVYGLGAVDLSDGHLSRINIWSITVEAIEDHWPAGTGIGTYPSVIPLYEDPNFVTSTYLTRAHNEYLQALLELGALGAGVIGFVLVWLSARIWGVWMTQGEGALVAFKKIASISVLAIVVHSIVDFPLRTPVIAVYFAMFIAVISMSSSKDLDLAKKPSALPVANPKRVVL